MILLTFGTRPEWIKIAPLVEVFENNSYPYEVIWVKQHDSLIPSEAKEKVDYSIDIKDGHRLNSIVSSVLDDSYIIDKKPSAVLVQGDTSSAFAIALSCFHNDIKVIHLEAGLRTNNIKSPFPEEYNRQVISKIADIHLCPTGAAKWNLRCEGIYDNVFVVGNTVLDSLPNYTPKITNKILFTMHRRENHNELGEWFEALDNLAAKYHEFEFVFPCHPNSIIQEKARRMNNVFITGHFTRQETAAFISKAALIITDSGGIQEEASFYKKRVVVCRDTTERIEGLPHFFQLCPTPDLLEQAFKDNMNYGIVDKPCPFGDGQTSDKIYKILKEQIV